MKKISIVILVYNIEKYLEECITSVIGQTLKDIEIIIINDGSTDNSLGIIEKYQKKDSRIVLINQENKGLSEARNRGIELASGEYVAFIDGDDFVDLNMYEELYESSENADIVFSNMNIYNDKTKQSKHLDFKLPFEKEEKGIFYFKYSFIGSCNKIYKRSFLLENKLFFERGLKYEDILFTLKACLCAKKYKFIKKNHYFYRVGRNGSITTVDDDILKIRAFEKIIKLIEKEENLYKDIDFSYARIYFQKMSMKLWILRSKKIKAKKEELKILEKQIKKIFSKQYSKNEFKVLRDDLQEIFQDNSYCVNLLSCFYWKYKLINLKIFRRKLLKK